MTKKEIVSDMIISFCVVTACVTILEGVMGMLFFPDQQLGYEAFFSPPLFGFFSAIFGLVTYSKKELSIKQMVFREIIHLLLIEFLVFGLNIAVGNLYDIRTCIALASSIAIVYVVVCIILWINDQRSATQFNQRLKQFQMQNRIPKDRV